MLEFLFISIVFISIIHFIFVLAWLFINKIWIEHHLYQAIVCVAEEREKSFCSNRLLKNIKSLNPKSEIKDLTFNKTQGEIIWRFYNKDFVIRQNFKLSL